MNDSEMQMILSNFPSIKLSYENFIHNKVYSADLYLAIPEGIKCFAWFTTYNDNNVCFIMVLNKNAQVINITIKPCCFNEELAYGTILYGTMFNNLNNTFFTIENVFYYKGRNIATYNWGNKNNIFLQLMNIDIKQASYNRRFIVFGLPLLSRNLDLLLNNIKLLNYNISVIQYRRYTGNNSYYFKPYTDIIKNIVTDYSSCVSHDNINTFITNKSIKGHVYQPLQTKTTLTTATKSQYINHLNTSKKQVVFKVMADIQNDIYNLYSVNDDGSDYFYGIAHIPNFNTSVMMNKFYRNIKENNNLDMLEESDSEDEFENEDPLRFVNLTKAYNFICAYNKKFRKWYPIQLAQDNMSIIQQKELILLEKNKH